MIIRIIRMLRNGDGKVIFQEICNQIRNVSSLKPYHGELRADVIQARYHSVNRGRDSHLRACLMNRIAWVVKSMVECLAAKWVE